MKKMLAVVLVAMVIGQVNVYAADPGAPLGMSVVKAGNICKLFYRGNERGDVHVSIYDEGGRVVFSEVIRKTDNFMRPYNFSTLPEGEYTIKLEDARIQRVEKFYHRYASRARLVKVVRVNPDENRYVVAVPNRGDDVLTIRIYDSRHALLFEGRERIHGDFAKVYNLNSVKGRQVFEIVDGHGHVSRVSKQSVR